jgi:hypothetical protein
MSRITHTKAPGILAEPLFFPSWLRVSQIGRMLSGWLKSLPNSSKNSVRFAGEKDIGNKGKE